MTLIHPITKLLQIHGCLAMLLLPPPAHAGEIPTEPEILVKQLDSPLFGQRRSAFQSLLTMGTSEDQAIAHQTVTAVRSGLQHPSTEVRLAAIDLLKRFRFHRVESNVRQLHDPSVPSDAIDIDGWQSFSSRAGSDMLSRRFFATLYRRHPLLLQSRSGLGDVDPLRLQRAETIAWGRLLWIDLDASVRQPKRSSQLGILLSQPNLGPIIDASPHSVVLGRLIVAWLKETPTSVSPMAQKIRIALRYDQRSVAHRFVDDVFSHPQSWPEADITALLAACALDRDDVIGRATQYLNDDRTGCVWKLVTSQKLRIRTQVKDVAMVVMLQSNGVDPRSAGFNYLEADPLLLFRDHSLGFPDETARKLAHGNGKRLLEHIQFDR